MANRNELGGKVSKVIGNVKKSVGRATGNRELEAEGSADHTVGTVREGIGKVEGKIDDAIDSAAREIRKS